MVESLKTPPSLKDGDVAIAILKFDDRNRYGVHGIPSLLLMQDNSRPWVVNCKRPTQTNHWAKVQVTSTEHRKAQLMDLLGPVGNYETELKAIQLHFRILPCRYPKPPYEEELNEEVPTTMEVEDCTRLSVFSIDDASTLDVDDALSLETVQDAHSTTGTTKYILGIHVANVARKINSEKHPLFAWAQARASSAYAGGVYDGSTTTVVHAPSSVPMLPPSLAHDELSLIEGESRHAISLFLTIEATSEENNYVITSKRHAQTLIRNSNKLTYEYWNSVTEKQDSYLVKCRELVQALSKEKEAEDLVAYTMITYNSYFGDYLVEAKQGGLLRAQLDPKVAAEYVPAESPNPRHASLEIQHYAHCSSPIRRFSDLVNQLVILYGSKQASLSMSMLQQYNARCHELKRYHATVNAMELAYTCRHEPQVYQGSVIQIDKRDDDGGDGGRSLWVQTPHRGGVRIPLKDSYFADPIVEILEEAMAQHQASTVQIELCGILLSGRTRLRARLVGVNLLGNQDRGKLPPPGFPGFPDANQEDAVIEKKEDDRENDDGDEEDDPRSILELPEEAKAWFNDHSKKLDEEMAATELKDSIVNKVLGYNIDQFQQNCLKVIVDPDQDLMAMAPTGSGKTAVALMAILQSFARGRRAFYTSPIKALSNQKYSEFTEWFKGRGIDAHVTLLTGDVKIRAPPDATNELIICTSEILRNKLVKASGGNHGSTSHIAAAAREAISKGDTAAQTALDIMIREGYISEAGDPDLERLGCVVSDEIHYINDVERGVVWEETLMHLPVNVQLVALSATLRNPEHFVEWIESVRKRQGTLVVRQDRHVPLHVGGLHPKSGDLIEFYGTHNDPEVERNAGQFDQKIFHDLFSRKALEARCSSDASRLAQKESARGARDAELQAQRDAFAGGPGKGGPPPKGSGRGGGGGTRGITTQRPPKINYKHECLTLAKSLDRVEKLPGIVFCMSRRMCVEGAHACRSLNLLLGSKPHKKPKEEDGTVALHLWEAEEEERKERVRKIQRKRARMKREHLQKYMPELSELEAYQDIEDLLACGVAYHHSGMLPILREFVELCFQQRLVRLVFATETLAVGVNMPARTVVFSQVDKPDDTSQGQGQHRWLRVDEFWQMAGRAGRRGLDTVGYVVYAPTLSVAGLKNIAPVYEFNRMLVGKVAPATSQLVVDRPFVLRHLLQGHDESILSKTLKSDEMRRQNNLALEQLTLKQGTQLTAKDQSNLELFDRYDEIEMKLSGNSHASGLKIKVSQKQQKKLMAEMRSIVQNFPGGEVAFKNAKEKAGESKRILEEIESKESLLKSAWTRHLEWLMAANFVQQDRITLTPRGICAAAFTNGEPLIMGTVIADGRLDSLNLHEICAWICLFIPYRAGGGNNGRPALPDNPIMPGAALLAVIDYSDSLAEQLGLEDPLEKTLARLMLDWLTYKDLNRIAATTDPHLLGSFVKAVMRVLSYLDTVKQVLLGLGMYETHNKLDHHAEALLGGLVTNESLYLHMQSE